MTNNLVDASWRLIAIERISQVDELEKQLAAVRQEICWQYRQGAIDWHDQPLPPDDNILLMAGLRNIGNQPSLPRDIEWHDEVSRLRAENAMLRQQLKEMQSE